MSRARVSVPAPKWFEVDDLPKLGWVRINYIGEENVYFEYINALGHTAEGFYKY